MTKIYQQWIGRIVFKAKNRIGDNSPSQLWWHPPTKKDLSTSHNLMLMCCDGSSYGCLGEPGLWTSGVHTVVLRGHYSKKVSCLYKHLIKFSLKGLYKKTLRIVVNLKDCYYLAIKELGCKECGKAFQSWDQR